MAKQRNIAFPDLTKENTRKGREKNDHWGLGGLVHDDFDVRGVFVGFDSRFKTRIGYSPHDDLTARIFLGQYSTEDAIYRSDFLGEWLDNRQTRRELDKIMGALPHDRLRFVRTNGRRDWGELSDEALKQQIRHVKKYFLLPEAFELASRFSGSSEASRDLVKFSMVARKELEAFAQFVKSIKAEPQFRDNQTTDYEWANGCVERIGRFTELLDHLRKIRFKLDYFRSMCIPFEFEFEGKRIPICKPVYLDPQRREGHIRSAFNPRYFEAEEIRVGKRWKRVVTKLNVPNDVDWDNQRRHIYVYGPNDMGKSVYLDTVALNVHLAMNGSYCFADSCELSLPGRLYPCFDLGDTVQSGHFVTGGHKLDQMLREVLPDDIIFLDEHAGGAEPDQERIIAKGITRALTKHNLTFFYATNDRSSWRHNIGKKRRQVLRVADYDDPARKYSVWQGIAKAGYSMRKAKDMGIDPESAERRLDERLAK